MTKITSPALAALLVFAGCAGPTGNGSTESHDIHDGGDVHSLSDPSAISVRHLELDLTVDFERHVIEGVAALHLEHHGESDRLTLDTRDLDIRKVWSSSQTMPLDYELGDDRDYLGRRLTIPLLPGEKTETVFVEYATDPGAAALQWVEPRQTAGGRHPFLLTQSQPILARSWIPCQDTPAVRMTYEATVRVPPGLLALMSARNPVEPSADGVYTFEMPQAIPSYLLALAVGEIAFETLGPRSGIYAEPSVIEAAAWEFAETEKIMDTAEALYGPYRWERFDMIVLPPSFPFGGMENPRLTFATPTVLAGDRSLVSLVSHELAHSWSGNLVTNATWNDFWLNEGFTVYFEQRITEELFGADYANMLALLEKKALLEEFAEFGPRSKDTHLFLDLAGRDPDEGPGWVAYSKGYLFLRMIEEHFGRQRWDDYLRGYFDRHAFRSMTTAGFLDDLRTHLLPADQAEREALERTLQIDAWVYGPGLPSNEPELVSLAFGRVEGEVARFLDGTGAAALAVDGWSTHEWVHFLHNLPERLESRRLVELDAAFGLTDRGNAEVQQAWLLIAIRNRYAPADEALEAFLTGVGRIKFLRPLYQELARSDAGRERARRIFAAARPGYHPLTTVAIERVLGLAQ